MCIRDSDRLTRSVADLAHLMSTAEEQGWALVILDLGVDTSTASGRMVANVIASVAQWEREVISERTKAALAVKRSEGVQLGRPKEHLSGNLDRITQLRSSGATIAAIAETMNDEGRMTARGGRFHIATVQRHLKAA